MNAKRNKFISGVIILFGMSLLFSYPGHHYNDFSYANWAFVFFVYFGGPLMYFFHALSTLSFFDIPISLVLLVFPILFFRGFLKSGKNTPLICGFALWFAEGALMVLAASA